MSGVQVSIGGVEYTVRTSLPQEKVAEVADFVERQLAMTASSAPTGDSYRVAILTLLKVAGEYLNLRSQPTRSGLDADEGRVLKDLLDRVDEVLLQEETDKGSPQGDFR
ncbi:MAG: hypothetical protein C0616_05585 [Desulfuromonas sp.]|nr:MAG: hypothetical protein C0616_05585 [Desulfuromonas sp.]